MSLAPSSWCHYPFTDQSASKKHPAAVVSTRAYSAVRPDVVVMAITSQLRQVPTFGEVWVSQWQQAGLLKPSVIKPVFATLEQPLISRQFGMLQPADQVALRQAIAEIIG